MRHRRGRGFTYQWADGTRVDDREILGRIRELVIPPAWENVWICPHANGHIQAVGTDAAGRRQYLYHPAWRIRRDAEKHHRVVEVACGLPRMRERVSADLATRGLNQRRVLAASVRLLDLGFFRIGSDQYAADGSYGLATMRREDTSIERGGTVVFDYTSKGGLDRYQSVADPDLVGVVRALLRRPDPSPELLSYWEKRSWHRIHSDDINDYLKEVFSADVTAKDFRTWHATVLAAVGLAVSTAARTPAQRRQAVARVMREVAGYLGNTPAVAKSSYVDRRIVDRFLAGEAIVDSLPALGKDTAAGHMATEGAVEKAVIAVLKDD